MRYHRFLPIVLLAVGTATVYAMAQQSSSSGSSSSSQSQSQGHGSASGSASASGYASAGGSQSGMATGNMQSGPATMYELDIEGDIDGAPVKLRTIVESRQTRNSVGSLSSYQSSSSSSSSLKNSESATIDSGLMKRNMDALRAYQTLRSRLIMKLPSTANLGQTWSADFKPVFDMRGGVVQYSYRRNERLEGVDCAQIEFKFMES